MDTETADALRALLAAQPIGALGTLRGADKGQPEPHVSMVPVAWLAGTEGTVGTADALIHVSTLSPHTRDMQSHPRVSLMLLCARTPGDNPLALARISVQADARPIGPDEPDYARARAAYLARFEQAAQTFELGDFALVRLAPHAVRFIAGFGRAHGVALDEFSRIVQALRSR
jgi:putative heme iron utilization protein